MEKVRKLKRKLTPSQRSSQKDPAPAARTEPTISIAKHSEPASQQSDTDAEAESVVTIDHEQPIAGTDADLAVNVESERSDGWPPFILIVGTSGHGKSTFINLFNPQPPAGVGHTSHSETKEVKPYKCSVGGREFGLVDTPGLDDTEDSDFTVLLAMSQWLESTYRQDLRVTGVIFMRDITEARMRKTSKHELQIFRMICGTHALGNVCFVTTKWDIVDRKIAVSREAELRNEFLNGEIQQGAKLLRHDNTLKSAAAIVCPLLDKPGIPLLIQQELVDQSKDFLSTNAFALITQGLCKERQTAEKDHDSQAVVRLDQRQAMMQYEGGVNYRARVEDLEKELRKSKKSSSSDWLQALQNITVSLIVPALSLYARYLLQSNAQDLEMAKVAAAHSETLWSTAGQYASTIASAVAQVAIKSWSGS